MQQQIHYTGHPFIDVGIGTVLAMVNKRQPQDITQDDLRSVAKNLLFWYIEKPAVKNYITTIFPNAPFTQPSMKAEDKLIYGKKMLFSFEHDNYFEGEGKRCVYFPHLQPVMLAKRQHIPLLNSEETTNFSARGVAGLPVSGLALLLIHAMPLGCVKCGGRYLAFHQLSRSDEPRSGMANWVMAKIGWEHNAKYIDFDGKIPAIGSYKRTRYVDGLLRARDTLGGRFGLHNISGYYYTNYGTGAEMEVLQLSNAVVDFVDAAQQDLSEAWNNLVQNSWVEEKVKEDEMPADIFLAWRNRLFENLFNAEERPQDFLKMLLGTLKGTSSHERFSLVRLFMRKVMNMQDAEIDLYIRIGHQLAEYVHEYDYNATRKSLSWKFYHSLKDARFDQLTRLVMSARERVSKSGNKSLLVPLDDFVKLIRAKRSYGQFELARDLVAYALFDKLHELGHTMHSSQVVPDDEDEIGNEYQLAIQYKEEE